MRTAGAISDAPVVTWRRILAFSAGVGVLAVALLSPLAELAHRSVAVHMAQHLLLVLAAAPLLAFSLAFSRPLLLLSKRAPALTELIDRQKSRPWGRAFTAFAGSFLWVAIVHAGAIWIWHLPGPYEAALQKEPLHAAEHLSFFLTACLFWRLVFAAAARRRYLPAAFLVLVTALQSCALGALLGLTRSVLYRTGPGPVPPWNLTPLADQQLAGALMWIPAGGVYLLTIVVLCAHAFGEMDRQSVGTDGNPAPAAEVAAEVRR